jgi:antirestriction protein
MEVVQYLTNKYEKDHYMSKKLEQYLENLPQVMQGIEEDYLRKIRLKHDYIERRDNYIEWFISHFAFYYHPPTEVYFKHVRNTFIEATEDELVQVIMRSLHIDFNLLHRGKQQMKRRLIRRVKSNVLFSAKPTTTMIENVLCFFHIHLENDTKSTYLLTCIGDILLGKRNLFYFMDPSFKPFILAIAQGLNTTVNKHIIEYFKFKYYDHDFKKCRIIPGIYNPNSIRMKYTDVAVVACYFSYMYGSSDAYLNQCCGNFEEKVMLLHTYHTPTLLFDYFLAEYTVSEPTSSISYKTVYFLWKVFVSKMTLPCVLSQHNFKRMLINKELLETDTEIMPNIGSRYPLSVLNLEMFWIQCMKQQSTTSYTVDEIVSLHNEWTEMKNAHLTADECKEWVSIYHSEHIVGTTVQGFECRLWDKTTDIENALEAHSMSDIDVYEFYSEYTSAQGKRVVSKDYFDHYLESR